MSDIRKKQFSVSHSKTLDEAQGICEHIVAVFGNVDHGKDRLMPGFFTKSLANKLPKGVWAHDWTLPVAKTLEARELLAGDALLPDAIKGNGGLYVKVQYNLGTQRGRDAFSDVSGGFVDEFSFGFDVSNSRYDSKSGVTDLVEGNIYEWSPVLWGMNPLTQHLSAKTLQPTSTHIKSVLGDRLPEQMTAAALYRVHDAILYILYDCIYNYRDLPLAERIQTVREACAEFGEACTLVMSTLLSDDEESTDEAKVAEFGQHLKSLMREPHPRLQAAENDTLRRKTLARAALILAGVTAEETGK